MHSVSFLRHAGWVGPEDLVDPIHVIGCGATGSHIALLAAKMGAHDIHIWDADLVESHNLPNQVYALKHIGKRKVDALTEVLLDFNPEIEVTAYPRFFEPRDANYLRGIVVIAVDSMAARKMLCDVFTLNANIDLVLETRLGFDYAEVNVIDNMDLDACESWRDSLRDDDEVPEGPCNLRLCVTMVSIVSAYVVQLICAYCAAARSKGAWEYKNKTMFTLNPLIDVHTL